MVPSKSVEKNLVVSTVNTYTMSDVTHSEKAAAGKSASDTKKRTRESELVVSVIINQAQTEYDGCYTGDVATGASTIMEEELREKFDIHLKTSVTIVDGDTTLYKPLVNAFNRLRNDPGPYSKC